MTYLSISSNVFENLPYFARIGGTTSISTSFWDVSEWLEVNFEPLSPWTCLKTAGWHGSYFSKASAPNVDEALGITDPIVALAFKLRWM